MLEHDEAGSAVTFPPLDDPFVSPLDSLSLPPQPAAANASAAKTPTSANALKLVLTLPPPSPVFAILGIMIGGVSGLSRRTASETRCGSRSSTSEFRTPLRSGRLPRTMEDRAEV